MIVKAYLFFLLVMNKSFKHQFMLNYASFCNNYKIVIILTNYKVAVVFFSLSFQIAIPSRIMPKPYNVTKGRNEIPK